MHGRLVALPLPDAVEALDEAGEQLARVIVTGPPGSGRGEGVPRVIRVRQTDGGAELAVAFPVPPPARPQEP